VAPPWPFKMCEGHNGDPPLILANVVPIKRLVHPIGFGYFENAASSSSAKRNIIGRWHVFAKHNLQPSIHINNVFTCPHMEQHIGIIVNSFESTVNTIVLP
jgi:hypothetical protein